MANEGKFLTSALLNRKIKNRQLLIPIFGIALFAILYFIASLFYPGGSQIDKNSRGFSWLNNYWCNLLNEKAINREPNPAKPVAIAGMCCLSISLSVFWFIFPKLINSEKRAGLLIQTTGILAMISALLLFTDLNHDLVTNLASLFGVVATMSTLVALYKLRWLGLFYFGLFNIFLVGLNNYLYYGKGLLVFLPVVQKITFASFLLWICLIDWSLYRRELKINNSDGSGINIPENGGNDTVVARN